MNRVRTIAILLVMLGASFTTYHVAFSHCEIPCGIYGDKTRIDLLLEDISTVEKSMQQINSLQNASPLNYNQIIRWVNNKEEHANKIQHIATQYFMTQRIKPKGMDDKAAYEKYTTQLTAMHGLMVHAMKAKQTTDVAHCEHMRKHIETFAKNYFSKEDLEHLRGHHK